jgi:hypothetical protein
VLEKALDETSISLKAGEPFSLETTLRIPATEVGRLAPTLRVSVDGTCLGTLPKSEQRQLVGLIFAESQFLKNCELVRHFEPLNESAFDCDIPTDLVRSLRLGIRSSVSVLLCLSSERAVVPGQPFRKGHWLAKKTFELNSEKEGMAFSIEPLDDHARNRLRLPDGTLYYVDYIGGFNEPLVADSPPARVYVDKDVIDRLALVSQQRQAAVVEGMLAAEITAALVARAVADLGEAEEIAPGTPLSSLLKRLRESSRLDDSAILAMARESGAPRLRAFLQADCEIVRSIIQG